MGKSNPFGGNVDQGFLPRIPKGIQVQVNRMGDLYIGFKLCNNGGERTEVATPI
jgi:hypothetical protein